MSTLETSIREEIAVCSDSSKRSVTQMQNGEVVICGQSDIPALCRMLYAEAGLAWPEPAWIKVADRLPEKTGRYIVQWRGGWMCDYPYDEHITDSSWSEGLILAWQPLPAAYKEDT